MNDSISKMSSVHFLTKDELKNIHGAGGCSPGDEWFYLLSSLGFCQDR